MLKLLGIGLGLFLINLVACQKQAEFDKQDLLETIITTYVMDSYADAVTTASALEQALNQFTTAPDLVKLETAQAAWKKSMEAWSKVEGLNFGPGRNQYRYLQLDNTPVRSPSIEAALADTTPIDLPYLQQRGSYTKGLATIEYLLFGAGNNAAILQGYQSDALAARRCAYVYYSGVHVSELLNALTEEWKDSYATELASQTDNSSTGGIARFSNVLLHLSQTIARKKVGKPLGKESGTGAIQPTLVESPYAEHSWAIIHANLLGLQALFGTEKNGMGSYLAHLLGDNSNTKKIAEQLDKLVTLTDNRMASLKMELTTQNAAVESVYEELKLLYNLLEEDYLPYVSITLLTNPDDGD
ncbi:MAG: imelysin family protein [Aureispira sp.]